MERPQIDKFNAAIPITGKELRDGANDFYFDVVDPMIRKEDATKYPDMWGNVWHKRNHPVPPELTPEQIHLNRVIELKSGITRCI